MMYDDEEEGSTCNLKTKIPTPTSYKEQIQKGTTPTGGSITAGTFAYDDVYSEVEIPPTPSVAMGKKFVHANDNDSTMDRASVGSSFMNYSYSNDYADDSTIATATVGPVRNIILNNNDAASSVGVLSTSVAPRYPRTPRNIPTPIRINSNNGEESDAEERRSCIPAWIVNASNSIKLVIVLATAMLVASLVLVSITASVSGNGRGSANGNNNSQSNTFGSSSSAPTPAKPVIWTITSSPTPEPVPSPFQETSSPTSSPVKSEFVPSSTTPAPTIKIPLDTHEPSVSPITSEPTRGQTTFMPTPSPSTTPPTSKPTATPSIPLATDVPSNVATSEPTAKPSMVTSEPTAKPSMVTDVPSHVPTLSKTLVPSSYPSIVQSDYPTLTPTEVPSVSALSASFFTLSNNRRTEDMVSKLSSLPLEHGEWLIHLGNWNNQNPERCTRRAYNNTANLYTNSPVPVFFVPGKLEWNHCPDYELSTAMWKEHFVGYEEKHWDMSWSKRGYTVTRQPRREENFAFDYKNSVYIGLNMVSGKVWDEKDWGDRLRANLEWVTQNVEKNLSADLIVMFGNTGPIKNNLPFFDELKKRIQDWTVDHRNLHFLYVKQNSSPLDLIQNVQGLDNFFMLNVESDHWPPTKISLDTNRYTMIFDDEEWYSQ